MLYLPRSNAAFLHIPKTGGTFVRGAIRVAGVECEPIGYEISDQKQSLEKLPARIRRGVRFFCFVRHPVAWYRSYWADRQLNGWGGDLLISHTCQASTFPLFVQKVCHHHRGFLSGLYRRYTGSPESPTLVGRTENLADDLIRFLHEVGEEFSEQAILDSPPVNRGASYESFRQQTACNESLLKKIHGNERRVYDCYGYGLDPPPFIDKPTE